VNRRKERKGIKSNKKIKIKGIIEKRDGGIFLKKRRGKEGKLNVSAPSLKNEIVNTGGSNRQNIQLVLFE
jgi:hypothetical protein